MTNSSDFQPEESAESNIHQSGDTDRSMSINSPISQIDLSDQVTISGSTVTHSTIHLMAHQGTIHQAYPWQPRWEPSPAEAQLLLDTMPTDRVPEIAALPSCSRMPFAPNPHFVGRDDVLIALATALHGGTRLSIGPKASVSGLGGVGKTSVAAEFVHRYGAFFAGGVFWLSFADPAAIPSEIAACGGPGLLDLHSSYGELKQDEQLALVRQAWQRPIPRLLIFDNCEDPELVRAWAPPSGGCRVLLTSRRQSWPSSLRVQTHSLDVLARSASVALLQELVLRLTAEQASALAEELGDFPLALQLAGSYLARFPHISVATYLTEVQSNVILAHPSLRGLHDEDILATAHDRHVGRTFLLIYQKLDPMRDALALSLLARTACLAPGAPIPVALLLASAELGPEDATGHVALGRLADLGFVTVGDDGVLLHRLMHAFVGAVMQDEAARATVEQALIEHASAINQTGYPAAMQPLLAHLRWAIQIAGERADQSLVMLCTNLAAYLESVGDYSGARPLYERALRICEQTLGLIHPYTATSVTHLAMLLETTGDYAPARQLYEQAVSIREQTLGQNHPSTATSLNNLARLLASMGEYQPARSLYERALVIIEQALGSMHPNTASTLNSLGVLLTSMGDYEQARPLLERAITISEHVLGPHHPSTATSLSNLAQLSESLGDYTTARRLYERSLAISEHVLGPDHPSTATMLNNLAYLLLTLENYQSAQPLFERSLGILEQSLGPVHPYTAAALDNLASLFLISGSYTKARPLLERALAIREQILGRNHPDTARSLSSLGNLYRALGDYSSAQPLYEQALSIQEDIFGPNHPIIAESLEHLADLHKLNQNNSLAQSLYERALMIARQAFGSYHPITASRLHSLALLFQAKEEYATAQSYLEEALVIRREVLGDKHPDTVSTFKHFTDVSELINNSVDNRLFFQIAQQFFEKAGFSWDESIHPEFMICTSIHESFSSQLPGAIGIHIIPGFILDGDAVRRIYEETRNILTQKPVTILVVVDQIPSHSGWLQIWSLRAEDVRIIPIDDVLIRKVQETGKARLELSNHLRRRLGTGENLYDERRPVAGLKFFGREIFTDEILRQLNMGHPVAILGLRKIGKSSVLARIRDQAPFAVAKIDMQSDMDLTNIFNKILNSWKRSLTLHAPELTWIPPIIAGTNASSQWAKVVTDLLCLLEEHDLEPRLGLLVDELDILLPRHEAEVERYLTFTRAVRGLVQEEEGRFCIIIAAVDPSFNRENNVIGGQQNPFYQFFRLRYLSALYPEDCILMIRNIGYQMGLSYSDDALQFIAAVTGGHPYLARQLCSVFLEHSVQQSTTWPSLITIDHLETAAQRMIRTPNEDDYLKGLWDQITRDPFWTIPQKFENEQMLRELAHMEPQETEFILAQAQDIQARNASLVELERRAVLELIENDKFVRMRLRLLRQWIQRNKVGMRGIQQ